MTQNDRREGVGVRLKMTDDNDREGVVLYKTAINSEGQTSNLKVIKDYPLTKKIGSKVGVWLAKLTFNAISVARS